MLSRRAFGQIAGGAALTTLWPVGLSLAANPTDTPLHGLSAFGELALPADYRHFAYVDPDAPKGGQLAFGVPDWAYNQNPQTFNTLNTFIAKGDAPPRMEAIFDTLMIRAEDEPSTVYGMLAESVTIGADRNSYTFKMRPEARFHDGTALTAHDAAWTLTTFRDEGHPQLALSLVHLASAEASDDATLVVTFDGNQSDRAVLTLAIMPILSRAWHEATPFANAVMETPLGSGAYRVGRVAVGRSITYERVEDWWARDLPFARGRNNFDEWRIDFFRERQAAFEAFKKGDITFREEFTSKTWKTEYDFPAITDGRAKQEELPAEAVPSLQAWFPNHRRAKLADPRTREAIGLAFDFEWTNANLFFGVYEQSASTFEGSDLAATGTPDAAELALLEPLRGKMPDSVFGEAVVPGATDGSGRDRARLRAASELLEQAGWVRQGGRLVKDGEALTLEFLIRSPTFERILAPFVANLTALGVGASIRLVDPAQYQARLDTFDFDITGVARRFDASPTAESLRQIFGSSSRDVTGSPNIAGIADPAVDALIDAAAAATTRAELVTALRALDRVLRSTHSLIPNWHSANHRVATWDIFGRPDTKPDYGFPFETTWWIDAEKAKASGKG